MDEFLDRWGWLIFVAAVGGLVIATRRDAEGAPSLPGIEPPAAATTHYSEVRPTPQQGYSYRVRGGDSLSNIALRVYGDVDFWPRLYVLNKAAIGADPNRIEIGTVLAIPPLLSLPS